MAEKSAGSMSVSDGVITLRLMTEHDLPMLHEWLNRPHIVKGWGGEAERPSLAQARRQYLPQVLAEAAVTPYIAMLGAEPIGCTQSCVAMGSGDGWWEDETDPGVRGIDQSLTSPARPNQGCGTRLVQALVERLFSDPAVSGPSAHGQRHDDQWPRGSRRVVEQRGASMWRPKVSNLTAILLLVVTAATSGWAQQPMPTNRVEATDVVRELRRIVTPRGVERSEFVRIGGIDQFVSIRGRDLRNPILLVLHGGPGFPETPLAWWNTRDLEEYFVVVHWDQRGAGKTYLVNDAAAVAASMQPETFIADTHELVAWLRKEFSKHKLFLLGHSWGSFVGLEYARRHPETLHAYIGVGQMTNTPESERRGYTYALTAARRAGNDEALTQLEAIAPYAAPGRPIPLQSIIIQRRWSDHFGGVMAYRERQSNGLASRLSPDYSDADAQRVYAGNDYSQDHLLNAVLNLDLSDIDKLDCPLILLAGRHDRTVNSEVAYEWFARVSAPRKRFVWFEHSAHEVMSEEPAKVLVSLLKHARPIAERSRDVAP